jgi:hypothetical protein
MYEISAHKTIFMQRLTKPISRSAHFLSLPIKADLTEIPVRSWKSWVSPFGVYVVHTPDAEKQRVLDILKPNLNKKVRTHEEAGEP